MNAAGLETEFARRIASLETSLGEILWRLHIPRIDYQPFIATQKIISGELRTRTRYTNITLKLLLWASTFFVTFYIVYNYKNGLSVQLAIAFFTFVLVFYLFLFGNDRAISRALYEARCDLPCDLLFGEGGVLMLSDFDIQMFSWDSMTAFFEDRHGHYLVMKHITVLMLPKAALDQHPDASALIAFIGQKTDQSGGQ